MSLWRFFPGILKVPKSEFLSKKMFQKESAKMPEYRIRVAPNTVAYADAENRKLAWIPMEDEKPTGFLGAHG